MLLLFQILSEGLKGAAISWCLGNHAAVAILFIVSAAQNDHLLSDLTMKTTSYNRQTSCLITYIHINMLGYKVESFKVL